MKSILKTISILTLLFIAATTVHAQYVHTWTFRMETNLLPTGYSPPSVTSLSSNAVKKDFLITVPASLDNASQSTALAAIGAAARDTILLHYLLGDWRVDTTDTRVRTFYTNVQRGNAEFMPTDYANQYKVGTPVFWIWGYTMWDDND